MNASVIHTSSIDTDEIARPNLENKPSMISLILFVGALVAGLAYAAYSILDDLSVSSHGKPVMNLAPFLLLVGALLIALGFEFVDGFHDTRMPLPR